MPTKRILVIDDDPDLRELVGMIGTSLGTEVVEAATCIEGLRVLSEQKDAIALVLLDYYMPCMTPLRCVEEIRRTTGGRVPIVLVTAAVDAAARAAELALPRWLSKPFGIDDLAHILREVA